MSGTDPFPYYLGSNEKQKLFGHSITDSLQKNYNILYFFPSSQPCFLLNVPDRLKCYTSKIQSSRVLLLHLKLLRGIRQRKVSRNHFCSLPVLGQPRGKTTPCNVGFVHCGVKESALAAPHPDLASGRRKKHPSVSGNVYSWSWERALNNLHATEKNVRHFKKKKLKLFSFKWVLYCALCCIMQ